MNKNKKNACLTCRSSKSIPVAMLYPAVHLYTISQPHYNVFTNFFEITYLFTFKSTL